MAQLLAPEALQQSSWAENLKPKRLAWLEGIRIISAVMILLYHAQLYFSNYAFTPQPIGLFDNLRHLLVASDRQEVPLLLRILSSPFWFGFQFLDVFILISGFSLVLSLKGQPLDTGRFLKRRLLRLLFPFWTVAWLSYPILWVLGTLTDSYKPDAWHSFAGITFPLTSDFRGSLLLSTSGPWWFIPLIISFTLISPFLWHLWQRWGIRNLLLFSVLVTVAYRVLAIYLLGGHPTYVAVNTPAHEEPFQLFLSKLSTFVVGMTIAVAYQQRRGPIYWSQRQAIIVGSLCYIAGFICQFYRVGWIVVDLLLPLGLALLCMVAMRSISNVSFIQHGLIQLGACSYSYFLIHNLVVDRTLNLVVQDSLMRYILLLPVMVLLTMILSIAVDLFQPVLKTVIFKTWNLIDSIMSRSYQPKP